MTLEEHTQVIRAAIKLAEDAGYAVYQRFADDNDGTVNLCIAENWLTDDEDDTVLF
ncbi:hypothetical protein ACWCO0_09620 [Streptomyces tubercidicus]